MNDTFLVIGTVGQVQADKPTGRLIGTWWANGYRIIKIRYNANQADMFEYVGDDRWVPLKEA